MVEIHQREVVSSLAVGMVLLLMFAAPSAAARTKGKVPPRPSANQANISEDASKLFRSAVRAGRLSDLRWPNFSDYRVQVDSFYHASNYSSAWLQNGIPTERALEMIGVLIDADREGLNPDDYDAPRWSARIAHLSDSHTPQDQARFDLALTISAMRYISDVSMGRVNPNHLQFAVDVRHRKLDLPGYLRQLLSTPSDLRAELIRIEPPFDGYRSARQALLRYMDLAKQDSPEGLPPPPGIVFPGGLYDGIPRLVRFLRLVGDLPQHAVLPRDPKLYDGALVEAVKRFQRRHGLPSDGYLTRQTVEQLNVPLSARVEQLQLTLERYRWWHYSFTQPRIVVNVPEFRLTAYDETGRIGLSMDVNVGDAYDFQTPIFENNIRFLVFRPYWNVPPGILRNEVIVDVAANRNYIRDNNMEVITRTGTVAASGTISDDVLHQLRSGNLLVRQKPGPNNALGLLKIVFPNQHHVYLHDTPQNARLFASGERTPSHGCIQLQRPADLARWLLRDQSGWNAKSVERAMKKGSDNFAIHLTKPIPIMIVYRTAVAVEEEEVYFYPDIYKRDDSLKKVLAKGYPYPKQTTPAI